MSLEKAVLIYAVFVYNMLASSWLAYLALSRPSSREDILFGVLFGTVVGAFDC